MKCPYCETENPDDAQECSNCSADFSTLFKGTPPPESYAPTMMTSSAEVAAMLAAARGESAPEPVAEPVEEPPVPDYSAPTMMTSSAEVAAMLAAAQASPASVDESDAGETPEEVAPFAEMPVEEVPMEEVPMELPDMPEEDSPIEETPLEEVPLEEVPMGEVPMGEPSAYAPTMISAIPDEVAEVLAAAQAEKMAVEEPAAPTFVGIPDPLGVTDSGKISAPAPDPEPVSPPQPVYHEPVSSPAAAPVTPEAPKDNRKIWMIGGAVGCVVILCCMCMLAFIVVPLISQGGF